MTETLYLYGVAEVNQQGLGFYTSDQLHHLEESIISRGVVKPVEMLRAVALMLRYSFGLEEATWVEKTIWKVIEEGTATKDIWELESSCQRMKRGEIFLTRCLNNVSQKNCIRRWWSEAYKKSVVAFA